MITQESFIKGLEKCKKLEEDKEMMEEMKQDAQDEFDRENKEYWLEQQGFLSNYEGQNG